MNGGSGSIAFNANDWLGVVADFGGYKNGNITNSAAPGASANATIISYMFGPRLSYRKNATWTPFAQALFGGAHGNISAKAGGVSLGSQSQDKLALTVGGGLDAKVSDHVAIRIIQAEYFMTTFDAGKAGSAAGVKVNHQNNIRLTFGIVFRFGGTK
jgi:opacity protein-like surface antigen